MPWSVPVKKKLQVRDVMKFMKDHHEGTSLNLQEDVGSRSWNSKFRARPIRWSYKGEQYVNERTIGTEQTFWSFVSEMRRSMPNHVGVCFWFAPDDATFAVLVPFYPFADIPKSLGTESGTIHKFSMDSQFWLNNIVANKVYHQWQLLAPVVEHKLWQLQDQFLEAQQLIESAALTRPQAEASAFLSAQTSEKAALLRDSWVQLWEKLVTHYRDGVVVEFQEKQHDQGDEFFARCKSVEWRDDWKKAIVEQRGDHFRVKKSVKQASESKKRVLVEKRPNFAKKTVPSIA